VCFSSTDCTRPSWRSPTAEEPGSGTHIHVSLLRDDGRSEFASDSLEPNETLRHAIGGLADTMADSMLVFAPTANSYRRFRPECYVPMAPTWGSQQPGCRPADSG